MKEKTKRKARPLLVISAGIALTTFGGSACFTCGNLIARPCVEEDGGPCQFEQEQPDGGTPSDGGVLGGDQ